MLRLFGQNRPALTPAKLSLLVSLYLLVVLNSAFWARGAAVFSGHEGKLSLLAIALLLAHIAGLLLFSNKYVFKPVLIFLIIVAASAAYFVDEFGVIIDHDMIRNTITTTVNEARHLLTSDFLLHMVIYALLPILVVVAVLVKRDPFRKQMARTSANIAVCLLVGTAILYVNYPSYSSVFRERQDFMGVVNPAAPVAGAIKYIRRAMRETNVVAAPYGTDARPGAASRAAEKPLFVVLIVGETARAQNFGLNGYARNTTPQLARHDVINFTDTSSCGTATAVSMPCMFSHYTRANFSNRKAKASENLLDIAQRAGFQVEWWDNNTGHKGIAKRVANQKFSSGTDPSFCREGECDDGILTDKLRSFIANANSNTLLVLHQIGSHGPTYYLRYPEDMEVFAPACRTAQFADCSQEEIIAAYDNTILYTDKNVSDIIDLASQNSDRLASAVIYMSDHGESLGESGLYLHGAPYFIAPNEQTKVPFVAWFSDQFSDQMHLNTDCVRAKQDDPVTHDALFHSMLGLMDIKTSVHNSALDLFGTCALHDDPQMVMSHDLQLDPASKALQ